MQLIHPVFMGVQRPVVPQSQPRFRGDTPDLYQEISNVLRLRDGLSQVKKILDASPGDLGDIRGAYMNQGSLLHLFASMNQPSDVTLFRDVITTLIERGVSVEAEDNRGNTAMHEGARYGNQFLLDVLVEHNGNVNARNHNDETPLHQVAPAGFGKNAKFLIEHDADVSLADKQGNLPIHLVAGNTPVARVLIAAMKKQRVPIDTKNLEGNTALHQNVRQMEAGTATLLIKAGANVNEPNNALQTPTHFVGANGRKEVIDLFLANGARLDLEDDKGRTPVDYANGKSPFGRFKNKTALRAFEAAA